MTTALIIILITVLVVISAACSGLNVALMGINLEGLKRKARLGNPQAKKVLPLRLKSHLSLASILISNVAVISATSIVMSSIINGVVAGLISTLIIVIFGEILPQAYFTRHALAMVAQFSWALKVMIFITYPLSKPLQLLLDVVLDAEDPELHSRQELGMMISEHTNQDASELDDDEVDIIRGALQLSEKRIRDVMTPIAETYWFNDSKTLTPAVVDKMVANSWSRIPVFNKKLTETRGIIILKELVDMDLDNLRLEASELPLHDLETVGPMTALDTVLRRFIRINSHMMAVKKGKKIIGIVTIEDVFEEIIGQEIEDETDANRD